MDLARIKRLLAIVAASDVAEVEIEEDGLKIVVRKNTPTIVMHPPPSYPPYNVGVFSPPVPMGEPTAAGDGGVRPGDPPTPVESNASAPYGRGSAASEAAQAPPDAVDSPVEHVVRAPIVGTYYSASSPQSDPFVSVGDRVAPGDILCIIEAMKLMNEIESEVSGVLRRILVENAEPVEYDQPLFVIEAD